uniref:Transporter n=1 Tax=Pygocentrus nattereri TaxID=42514 RepID=A0AAR2M0H2_PYGNA
SHKLKQVQSEDRDEELVFADVWCFLQMSCEKPPLPPADMGVEQDAGPVAVPEAPPEAARGGWDSKVEYFLAQVGFSVGLGNVWRFPYLCHQNGGGAFLLLYIVLMVLVGVPLFFLELAAGQHIRQGSIGVWRHISPKLVGIGYSSCVVCFFVALYYNVIIGWSIFYLLNSFQSPLPWEKCPREGNNTVAECAASSATSYFWYRKALDVTDSISETGQFNLVITGCLAIAWVIVCLAMYKGIKSTGKVMYFSSVFPYVVLLCFLVRGLMLDGASEGIMYMLYPKLEIWGNVQVWRQAATQVFFALGLGFGSVIAYSSYNPRSNNCHRDAITVSSVNFFTSVLASLVVFAVLGFRAKTFAKECIIRNLKLVSEAGITSLLINVTEPNSVSLETYAHWYEFQGKGLYITDTNITSCNLDDEMKKGVQGTGLAFIVFTEAMTLFPASPFWSALFFLMLLNLGLSTMFGTMAGILTPLTDTFKTLRKRKLSCSCAVGFLIGLLFTQRCGNYFVVMFDDYSATLPLIIVVVFQTVSIAWVYGADRFLEDIRQMLGRPVWGVYKYLWKYVCLSAMLGLLCASLLRMCFSRPKYTAWNREKAVEEELEYPDWALAVLSSLIVIAVLPVPLGYAYSVLQQRTGQSALDTEAGYAPCSTTDTDPTPNSTPMAEENFGLLACGEGAEQGEESTRV